MGFAKANFLCIEIAIGVANWFITANGKQIVVLLINTLRYILFFRTKKKTHYLITQRRIFYLLRERYKVLGIYDFMIMI